jgi:hypothetical protein
MRGGINSPQILGLLQNSRWITFHNNGPLKYSPLYKVSRPGKLAPGICAPLSFLVFSSHKPAFAWRKQEHSEDTERLHFHIHHTKLEFYFLSTVHHDIRMSWNQVDALFIFSLFSHYTSTCFGLAGCPSSGGNNVYMQNLVRVVPFRADSHIPCRSANGLYCVFPIWFTQSGRVWFTHTMPFPCHATNMTFWKRSYKATGGSRQGNGMVCVN